MLGQPGRQMKRALIFRVDEDVIKIDNDTEIEEVAEDVIHEMLEGCKGIDEAERHQLPLEGAITSIEA